MAVSHVLAHLLFATTVGFDGPAHPSAEAEQAFRRGEEVKAKQNHEEAIRAYDEAIRLAPAFADAFRQRGRCRCAKGQFDQGIADLTEAIRLKPGDASYWQFRGMAWFSKND